MIGRGEFAGEGGLDGMNMTAEMTSDRTIVDTPSQATRCAAPSQQEETWRADIPSGPQESTRSILDSVRDLQQFLDEYSEPATDEYETVARSPQMQSVLAEARRYAATSATVLIDGESGTGKERIARLIHTASSRALRPYVQVNCAALSESLIESELFGHERGAFTGATEARMGRFELADGGTLLLDEIGEMPIRLQAKLLRVLEEQEFERVGGMKTIRVNTRIIATTNRTLEREVAEGKFRRDLFYRLNVVRIQIPPLRDRLEDIPALAAYFLRRFRADASVPVEGFAPATLQRLMAHDWPGNVREFRNVIQSTCIRATGEFLQPDDLPRLSQSHPDNVGSRSATLEQIERDVILSTLREFGGNKTAAARKLGVTSRTLLNKLKLYRAQDAA